MKHWTPEDPHFVYTFSNESGAALYVGCTHNFASRMWAHQSQRPWFADVARVEVIRYPNAAAGLAAEREAIAELKPLHNIAHHPDRPSRGGWDARRAKFAADHTLGVTHRGRQGCRECANASRQALATED